jgi:hypothetical protein
LRRLLSLSSNKSSVPQIARCLSSLNLFFFVRGGEIPPLLQLAEHCENGSRGCGGEEGSIGVGTGSKGEPADNGHDKGVTGEREKGG